MKVFFNKQNLKCWVVFAISLVIALVAYGKLPDQIPIHWGFSGEADGWGGKGWIFMGPGLALFSIVLAEIRRIDPKKENYNKFASQYYFMFFLIALIGLVIELITIGVVSGINLNVSTIILLAVAVLFIFMGNAMPKFKHNYYAGIRTSWTLANEDVWYATHRFTGKVWFAMGLVMVPLAFLPPRLSAICIIPVIAVGSLAGVIYSYLYFRKVSANQADEDDE